MKIFCLFFLLSLSVFADVTGLEGFQTKTPEDDRAKISENLQVCELIKQLIIRNAFGVECNNKYHYFGSSVRSLKKLAPTPIKIAVYNLLHPGTSKALFKDYDLIAKIINNYDLVSGLELLNTVGHDEVNNKAVIDFLISVPKLIADLEAQKTKTTIPVKIQEIDLKIAKLNSDIQKAYSLYRAPGYLKVLLALKKLDPSWSLILTPRGDSALEGSVEELVGYFFRSNVVTPTTNPHCKEFQEDNSVVPVACLVNISEHFLDKDYTHYFARRPFMASFISGSTKFSLLSNHVVFTFAGDEENSKKLMRDVFNVENPSALGGGINSTNFARFAEVKIVLQFMDMFRKKYNDQKLMYLADTNLNFNISFWSEILKSYTGASLLIDQPTTVSPQRYNSEGKETNGVANSYDHFILDKMVFSNCSNGEVYNYYNSEINKDIEYIYGMRSPEKFHSIFRTKSFLPLDEGGQGGDVPPDEQPLPTKLDYPLTTLAQEKMNRMAINYSSLLKNYVTIKRNEIVADDFQLTERLESYQRRVFINQLTNAFYYKFYQEILSDHFPASISCKF